MTDHARKVLRVSGTDALKFLQGLVTNDVDKLANGIVYTAMLTAQGKYRADFFLVPDLVPDLNPDLNPDLDPRTGTAAILIDADATQAAALKQVLTMYKLRSDVQIADTDLTVSRGLGLPPAGAFADPRDTALGWRGYAGQPDEPVDWDALRVAACVPRSGVELTPDTFILEAGFERLGGVDFKKGCYVGQEVTARMKHKTELRKGLARVGVDGSAPVGTQITADGKPVGTLYTQAGGAGIAYLRYDRAKGPLIAGDARVTYTG